MRRNIIVIAWQISQVIARRVFAPPGSAKVGHLSINGLSVREARRNHESNRAEVFGDSFLQEWGQDSRVRLVSRFCRSFRLEGRHGLNGRRFVLFSNLLALRFTRLVFFLVMFVATQTLWTFGSRRFGGRSSSSDKHQTRNQNGRPQPVFSA